ncbi:MAG TPA: HU family DNA-binding protein [Balneolaceae bacterium]
MSEKLTFQELIESIAEETDNSQQFTRDFIKDFVDIISDELKSGDNINIAGFGKFKLQKVDEREGYNPQTEEKMTIPAHHKLVFKPYKDLREVVNAPYAHLEPTLIEDEKSDAEPAAEPEQKDAAKSDEKELNKKQSPIIDELESLLSDESNEEESTEETFDPFSFTSGDFDFNEEREEENTERDDVKEEDIVEYRDEPAANKYEVDEDLAEFMGSTEDQPENQQKETVTEVNYSPTSPLGIALNDDNDPNETGSKELAVTSVAVTQQPSQKKSSSVVTVLVTAILLLVIAAGAWYFSTFSDAGLQKAESKRLISAATVPTKDAVNRQAQQAKTDNQAVPNQTNRTMQNGANAPEELVIAKGATLWSIAGAQLGNPRLWPWIYDTNESIENPDLIFAGATLSVPRPSGVPSGLSSGDSIAVAKGYAAAYLWYKKHHSPKAKNYLWAAGKYHEKIWSLANIQIDNADLSATGKAR